MYTHTSVHIHYSISVFMLYLLLISFFVKQPDFGSDRYFLGTLSFRLICSQPCMIFSRHLKCLLADCWGCMFFPVGLLLLLLYPVHTLTRNTAISIVRTSFQLVCGASSVAVYLEQSWLSPLLRWLHGGYPRMCLFLIRSFWNVS